jgi:hypothetical protein
VPAQCSVAHSTASSDDRLTPPHLQFIDWLTAQTWRKALIEATDTDLVEQWKAASHDLRP